MVQHPRQTSLAYNLTESSAEQSTQIDTFIFKKIYIYVLYYHCYELL